MIGDTPRTDAARHDEHDPYMAVASECAKLELELNVANKTNKLQYELITTAEKRGVDKSKEELKAAYDRIKRLEEVLESIREYCIREYCTRPKNEQAMIDACWYAIDTAAKALKAKEAKL
jgi:hypothetical protein